MSVLLAQEIVLQPDCERNERNITQGEIYADTSVANIADRWNYRGTDNDSTHYDTDVCIGRSPFRLHWSDCR